MRDCPVDRCRVQCCLHGRHQRDGRAFYQLLVVFDMKTLWYVPFQRYFGLNNGLRYRVFRGAHLHHRCLDGLALLRNGPFRTFKKS